MSSKRVVAVDEDLDIPVRGDGSIPTEAELGPTEVVPGGPVGVDQDLLEDDMAGPSMDEEVLKEYLKAMKDNTRYGVDLRDSNLVPLTKEEPTEVLIERNAEESEVQFKWDVLVFLGLLKGLDGAEIFGLIQKRPDLLDDVFDHSFESLNNQLEYKGYEAFVDEDGGISLRLTPERIEFQQVLGKIKQSVEYGAKTAWEKQSKRQQQANGYSVTLRFGGRRASWDYWMGIVCKGEPKTRELLQSLIQDSRIFYDAGGSTSEPITLPMIQSYLSEMGGEGEERDQLKEARRTMSAMKANASKLERLFGDEFEKLKDRSEFFDYGWGRDS